jgi:GMP synthase-like glutamine amidotransferase
VPHANVLAHRDIANELGLIGEWMDARGWTNRRFWREDDADIGGDGFPEADALIVLGSLDSVATGHCAVWAPDEMHRIRRWIGEDRPYLGVCFGAQILATTLGGEVQRRSTFYRAVETVPWTGGPSRGPWVLWHEDAITSPGSAQVVSELPHAVIALRSGNAWGVQAHIELDASALERLARAVDAPEETSRPLIDLLRENAEQVTAATFQFLDLALSSPPTQAPPS